MSIFSGGKKWGNRAAQVRAYAQQAEQELEDYNFGRDILTNIRRQRIAASQLRMLEGGSSDIQTTAFQGQMANINSGLASDYGYSAYMSKESERIQRMYDTATRYEKKAAKMDKRASIAGMAVAAPVALATTVLTGGTALAAWAPVFGAAAGAATTGIISATGGGRAAVAGSIQGTILGTSAGYTLSGAGVGLGTSSAGTATGTVTEAGGTMSTYAVNGVTQATSATQSAATTSAITYTPTAAISLKDAATLASDFYKIKNEYDRVATRENVFSSRGYNQ